MLKNIQELFNDAKLVKKIQTKLPKLFQLAELESSRAGRVGMEVGSLRERILVALLIYVFGERNVKSDIPITEPETDVIVYDTPISIKTITGSGGVKLIWTVDAAQALEFSKNYQPSCDMLFVRINWSNGGGLYYFAKETQRTILNEMGRTSYIKLPKQGTNPRGVEMQPRAIENLIKNTNTLCVPIDWKKESIDYKPFERWVELWQED
jgi:hypothetical protein